MAKKEPEDRKSSKRAMDRDNRKQGERTDVTGKRKRKRTDVIVPKIIKV